MYEDLQKLRALGARCLYMDTGKLNMEGEIISCIPTPLLLIADSIIFDAPSSLDTAHLEREFRLGSKAYGAFKHEVSNIKNYSCMGPKNYAIQLSKFEKK